MIDAARQQTPSQVLRFVLVGGINTALTGAIFLGLSAITAPTFAYTVAFVIGIGFAVAVTPRIVFRARASATQRLRYVVWYLTVYLLGLGIVYVLHDRWSVATATVAVVTFVVTAGLSFVGARSLFGRGPRSGAGPMNDSAER